MRAIIIDDKDARMLLDRLKLASFNDLHPNMRLEGKSHTEIVRDIHAVFHYEVVRWLQDQGCNTTR